MKRYLLAAAAAIVAAFPATAHEFTAGDIVVDHPWSRQTPPNASVGAGYFSVTNHGTEPERLLSGSATVSDGFEFHSSEAVDGIARMRPIEGPVEIAPGETVSFGPGGDHVMLTGLKEPIRAGEPLAGSLTFERAGTVELEFSVESLGAPAPAVTPAPPVDHSGH